MKFSEVRGYKIEEMIGKGSFGKVYRGSHLVTGEKVALKIIECQGKKKQELNNLRQEINIMKKLKHPNIINLIDFAETPTEIIIIMEFAEQDMSVLLEKLKKLPEEEVRSICKQIIQALMYLNQNRIVHRDLKPQNILLVDKNIPKICDFGFAKKMSASTVCLHSMKGTPLYIAPEIILQKPYNHKIDVWSFGVIIYQFYTGIPPFYADSFPKLGPKILNDKVIYPKNMPLQLKQLLQGMLQKSPSLRFDWKEILNHPFFNVKNKNNDKENLPESWMLDENFKMVESQYNFDPHANLNPAEVDLATIKQIQNNIIQGKPQAKSYKSDPILYHQIMSIINKFSQQSPSTSNDIDLIRAVLSIEINLVRKKTDNKEDDFTKKPQLLISVAKLIPNFSQQEILIQIYTLLGFLLKSNFNDLNLEVESAEEIVVSSAELLCKSGRLSPNLLHYISIAIGVIAGQAMSNLMIAQDLIKDVEESRLLYYLTNRINRGQSSVPSIFQCLCKFLHPLKGNKIVLNPKLFLVFNRLKSQVGLALSSKLHDFMSYSGSLLGNQLDHFFYVVYESLKQSQQLKIKVLDRKFQILPLLEKNRLYCLGINCILQKFSRFKFALFSQEHVIGILKSNTYKPVQELLLAASLAESFNITPPTQATARLLIQKLHRLIELQKRIKEEALQQLEGWSYGTLTYKFDDLIILSYTQLMKSSENVLKISQAFKIVPLLVKVQHTNSQVSLNISSKYFKYLMELYQYLKSSLSSNDRKTLLTSLSEGLTVLTLQTHLCSIKQEQGQKQFCQFIQLTLNTIYDIQDSKYNRDFYTKLSQTQIHRHIFKDEEIKPNTLMKSLRTINVNFRYSKDHNTLDYIAVQGLPKLKPFLANQNSDLLLQIVLVVTHLARTKQDYYPNINQLGIIKHIPKYLQGGRELKIATLKLLANLLKHSDQFLDQLTENKIFDLITNNMQLQENIVILTQNAVANASHFRQLNEQIIQPIIKCMPCLLVFPQHQNDNRALDAILSLCNFLRHSSKHLPLILKSKIIGKVLSILDDIPNNTHLINAGIRLLSKIVENGKVDLLKYHTKEEIIRIVDKVKPAEARDAFGKMASTIRERLAG